MDRNTDTVFEMVAVAQEGHQQYVQPVEVDILDNFDLDIVHKRLAADDSPDNLLAAVHKLADAAADIVEKLVAAGMELIAVVELLLLLKMQLMLELMAEKLVAFDLVLDNWVAYEHLK